MAGGIHDVVIVGGGPAGMMAGLLFARAGVDTLVLEKHADFFRDFRGDTVHPSTMELLCELGMLERFLARPHHRLDSAEIDWEGRLFKVADLSHLPTPAPFIAMMPQWDFLDFLRDEAAAFPCFHLRMEAPVAGFLERDGRIAGVMLASGETIRAGKLVIACDGRDSLVRQRHLLLLEDLGAPIDVFWFAVPKSRQGNAVRGSIRGNHMIVQIDRGDYWQCAYVIAKGSAEAVRARGIAAFRADVRATSPELPDLAEVLPDFDAVKLLSVSLDRLAEWHRPGLLAIGDAAHAMSPVVTASGPTPKRSVPCSEYHVVNVWNVNCNRKDATKTARRPGTAPAIAAPTASASARYEGSLPGAIVSAGRRRPVTIAALMASTVIEAARNAVVMPKTWPSIRKPMAATHIWNVADPAARERNLDGTASASSAWNGARGMLVPV